MPKLIDAHTHVQIKQFNKDRKEVIGRALERDIWLVNVGDNKKTSVDAVEIANSYVEGIYATIGQHPNEKEIFDYDFYKKLVQDKKVVAIGECGLEYYRTDEWKDENAEKKRQQELFLTQISLAKETKLPLMIHTRDAIDETIETLKKNYSVSQNPGIVHFFTGNIEYAKKFLDMGFSFTFGGLVTFNRSFDEVLKYIPIENILIETDAPFVAPNPHRGERNEPAYVEEVAKTLAQIKEISLTEVSQITVENTRRILSI